MLEHLRRWAGRVVLGLRGVCGMMPDIDREIEREFHEHIEARAEWFREQGDDEETARARAIEAFGDWDTAAAECRARLMRTRERAALSLSRVMALCTLGLAGAGVWLGATAWSAASQRSQTATQLAEAIKHGEAMEIANHQLELAIEQLRGDRLAEQETLLQDLMQTYNTVRVRGAVLREGVWLMPRDNPLTVAQLISKIGVAADATGEVTVSQRLGPQTQRTITCSLRSSDAAETANVPLLGTCDVYVQ